MSHVYFCFSDENGDYKPNMTPKQLTRHPFYIRATLLMNANEWKNLNIRFRELKTKYGLPKGKEIKWAFIWSLRHFTKKSKMIPNNHELKFLDGYDYHNLINFVDESLALLHEIKEKRIIITFTDNSKTPAINEKSLLAMHLQEHMQRIEMELQVDDENLGVLFFDPVSKQKDEMFREIYNELFENGDFIENYKFIKDSLNIEKSHQSVGIQIADYISGSFSSVVKYNRGDYSRGISMFLNHVKPYLRKNPSNNIFGYGIREVPRNQDIRNWIVDVIEKQIPNKKSS